MPKRSRSHQLEDLSIQNFEKLLPEQWVCRRKDKDYGVDLEVEIFGEDGNATGFIFYVQVKATDNTKNERVVSMKVDRLEYLKSLDLPSMVVRYCHENRSFHWSWVSNIFANNPKPLGSTLGVKFEPTDKWKGDDPEAIHRTLRTYRTIKSASRQIPIGLFVSTKGLSPSAAFELNHAVSSLLDATSLINRSSDPRISLPISIQLTDDLLQLSIDVISSIGIRLVRIERNEILNKLSYAIAYMASGYEFSTQALDIVRAIVRLGLTTNSRYIASSVACSALSDPHLASEVASNNKLHAYQDEAYLKYIDQLLSSDIPIAGKTSAVRRFYIEAIALYEDEPEFSSATLHYSLANFLRVSGNYMESIHHYNVARKRDSDYLARDYFLAELGAALFFKGRFLMSAGYYIASYRVTPKSQIAICAGDAHLYSGKFKEAAEWYGSAGSCAIDEFESAEVYLKVWLADFANHFAQHNPVNGSAWIAAQHLWEEVMKQALEEEEYPGALFACQMIGFRADHGVDLWSTAVSIVVKMGQPQHVVAVFACAIWRCGYDSYSPLRDALSKKDAPVDMLRSLDEIVGHFYNLSSTSKTSGVTIRSREKHQFDTVTTQSEEAGSS